MKSYWAHEPHWDWEHHYFPASCGGTVLVFDPEWGAQHLPPDLFNGPHIKGLRVTLQDAEDGALYEVPMVAAYENKDHRLILMDRHGRESAVGSLQGYFYASHYCPCHRKQDARDHGATVDAELECEGQRFRVVKIVAPEHPDLILYSETIPEDELERALVHAA